MKFINNIGKALACSALSGLILTPALADNLSEQVTVYGLDIVHTSEGDGSVTTISNHPFTLESERNSVSGADSGLVGATGNEEIDTSEFERELHELGLIGDLVAEVGIMTIEDTSTMEYVSRGLKVVGKGESDDFLITVTYNGIDVEEECTYSKSVNLESVSFDGCGVKITNSPYYPVVASKL